jgi:hypothetical protein
MLDVTPIAFVALARDRDGEKLQEVHHGWAHADVAWNRGSCSVRAAIRVSAEDTRASGPATMTCGATPSSRHAPVTTGAARVTSRGRRHSDPTTRARVVPVCRSLVRALPARHRVVDAAEAAVVE